MIGGDAQSINREEKEVDAYVEGYIAFMRQCKYDQGLSQILIGRYYSVNCRMCF